MESSSGLAVVRSTADANRPLFVGFDLGTSGARVSVIRNKSKDKQNEYPSSTQYEEVYTQAVAWSDDQGGKSRYSDPDAWMEAVGDMLQGASRNLTSLESVTAICVSGTSASCLLVDGANAGMVTRAPCMYDYNVLTSEGLDPIYGVKAIDCLDAYAPPRHTARSPTGSLAKLLAWHEERPLQKKERLCHQADYVALQLLSESKACGSAGKNQRVVASDWHNCLKLGYDVRNLQWPNWLHKCLLEQGINPDEVLPSTVVSPGQPIGTISVDAAKRFGLPKTTVVVGGTTDSNAAFFAATAGSQLSPGTAVTSLGSTLAIKQLSATYVEDASVGVYSHRFPSVLTKAPGQQEEAWLIGGASNVGCAILRKEGFSNDELDQLSQKIDPGTDSPLYYYPLTEKGERFPVADSNKLPVLEPVPDDRSDYLHAILQGISNVEKAGFTILGQLGASPSQPCQVWTSGGGSRNNMWNQMRQRRLREAFGSKSIHVSRSNFVEASYGAAILAAVSFQ